MFLCACELSRLICLTIDDDCGGHLPHQAHVTPTKVSSCGLLLAALASMQISVRWLQVGASESKEGAVLRELHSRAAGATALLLLPLLPHSILHTLFHFISFFSRSNPSHRLCYLGASGRRDRCLSRGCICFGRHRVGRVHGEGHTCLIAIPLTLCLHQAAPQRCLQPICNGDCWFAPRSCRSSSS